MESADELKTVARQVSLEQWLQADPAMASMVLQAMPGAASFRRYFRVSTQNASFVAMDAPPETENCQPFVVMAEALRHRGLKTPFIFKADIARGFLLLSDFGDLTYLSALNAQNADVLYGRALTALSVLQGCKEIEGCTLPSFNREFMEKEWAWHKEWFLTKLLGLPLEDESTLDDCYARIVGSAVTESQVLMHRDYHAGNLMVVAGRDNQQVGVLDFQDAFIGPVTYDVVSLLRDCYIDWPEEKVQQWALTYWQALRNLGQLQEVDQPTFLQQFDLMGMQRHLKALLTFARKQVRDGQPQYLKHIPRTLNYLLQVSARYPEFLGLHLYYKNTVLPAFRSAYPCVL